MDILLATDGLEPARAAEELITRVARRDSRVLVVAITGEADADRAGGSEAATKAAERLEASGLEAGAECIVGDPANVLLELAASRPCDLLAMGAGNKAWLGRALFGSVSTKLLHSAPVPVLIVHEVQPAADRIRVLVASDGSDDGALGLDSARALFDPERVVLKLFGVVAVRVPSFSGVPSVGYAAPGFDAEMEAKLTAGTEQRLAEEAERLRREGYEVERDAILGSPVKRILEQAQSDRADVVVVGTHPRGRLDRALVGSVSDQVARFSPAALVARRGPDST